VQDNHYYKRLLGLKNSRKGQVTTYVVFSVFAILILLVMAVMFPLGVRINTEVYAAGETIMLSSNDSLSKISNVTIRDSIKDSINGALENTENNIAVNAGFFKYSGLLMIGIIAFVMFMLVRQRKQVQQGFT